LKIYRRSNFKTEITRGNQSFTKKFLLNTGRSIHRECGENFFIPSPSANLEGEGRSNCEKEMPFGAILCVLRAFSTTLVFSTEEKVP
jgi:hypothetical protein